MSPHALLTLADGTLACASRLPFKTPPRAGALCIVRAADGFTDPATMLRVEDREEPPVASESVEFVSFATKAEAARAAANAEAGAEARKVVEESLAGLGKEAVALRLRYSMRRERLVVQVAPQSFVDVRALHDAIAAKLRCQVDVRIVQPRALAAATGGLGICGRRLCCSLGICPAREKDGAVQRSRDVVAGLCGRPCCCLGC